MEIYQYLPSDNCGWNVYCRGLGLHRSSGLICFACEDTKWPGFPAFPGRFDCQNTKWPGFAAFPGRFLISRLLQNVRGRCQQTEPNTN